MRTINIDISAISSIMSYMFKMERYIYFSAPDVHKIEIGLPNT